MEPKPWHEGDDAPALGSRPGPCRGICDDLESMRAEAGTASVLRRPFRAGGRQYGPGDRRCGTCELMYPAPAPPRCICCHRLMRQMYYPDGTPTGRAMGMKRRLAEKNSRKPVGSQVTRMCADRCGTEIPFGKGHPTRCPKCFAVRQAARAPKPRPCRGCKDGSVPAGSNGNRWYCDECLTKGGRKHWASANKARAAAKFTSREPRPCKACPVLIPASAHGHVKYCPTCARERRRQSARAYDVRRYEARCRKAPHLLT